MSVDENNGIVVTIYNQEKKDTTHGIRCQLRDGHAMIHWTLFDVSTAKINYMPLH